MSEYKRPLPAVTDYTKPFWEAASRGGAAHTTLQEVRFLHLVSEAVMPEMRLA
jgi:hypothetical protein